jgi:hypothetical protein
MGERSPISKDMRKDHLLSVDSVEIENLVLANLDANHPNNGIPH